jgi:hypothetical protein
MASLSNIGNISEPEVEEAKEENYQQIQRVIQLFKNGVNIRPNTPAETVA